MTTIPSDGPRGFNRPETGNTPLNQMEFFFRAMMSRVHVAMLGKVVSVQGGGVGAVPGTVHVQPLLDFLDGNGKAWHQAPIFNIPYFRLQGGQSGIICDPVPGDVGLIVVRDRDHSQVQNRQPGIPPTARRFSPSDGFFIGGWNDAPVPDQYIYLADGEAIGIGAPNGVVVLDGSVNIQDAVLEVAGTQVVGPQQPNIPPPAGGIIIDPQARVAITQILSLLQTHGLMA